MAGGFSALVRRRRDGTVAFDLDLVHAGVVTEALEQTRAVLAGDTRAEADEDGPAIRVTEPTDEFERIVAGLELAGTAEGGHDPSPADPVLRRLLPDAFDGDAEASAEFRRLTGGSVRDGKVAAIDSALADLARLRAQEGGVVLEAERAARWLPALNDARLALATLLELTDDDDLYAELDAYEQQVEAAAEAGVVTEDAERSLRAYRIAVYDFLSALLDMVVQALDR